ncbi:ABC-type transport auxiliary lipoprotein family protein [Ahniella affigens]|nr:ABC-type transport auxiliary lipoprotein family protein [Ahniella affigens]
MPLPRLPTLLLRTGAVLAILLLAACASAPVPDMAFYRMSSVPDRERAADAEPRFPVPITVSPFRADGVYNDQAILYAVKPEGSIKAYHYQLWDEPPSLMLQRRLIDQLRAEYAAKLITDRLPPGLDALRISGRLQRFERVRMNQRWHARVRMEIRVERRQQDAPLLLNDYGADVEAESDTIQASIRAFAAALDQSYAAFSADLAQLDLSPKAP